MKKKGKMVGYDTKLSGHSLRVGGVTLVVEKRMVFGRNMCSWWMEVSSCFALFERLCCG